MPSLSLRPDICACRHCTPTAPTRLLTALSTSSLKKGVSQRLIPRADGEGRVPAVEIMLNTPLMSDLIFKGHVHEIKELMAKSNELGMQTFDQALFELYESKRITYEDALRNADSLNDLRLRIKLESKGSKKEDLMSGLDKLSVEESSDSTTASVMR